MVIKDTVKFSTLEGVNLNELLRVFNESFSNYFVPLQLTSDQLGAKILSDNVNLSYSVGSFYNGKLVGFILHGLDLLDGKKLAYNAGTGVIPKCRGQHLTEKMYQFILPKLKDDKVFSIGLEVITVNRHAVSAYSKVGFIPHRELACYKGEIISPRIAEFEILEVSEYPWRTMHSFWSFEPSWQNSLNVVQQLCQTNKCYLAFKGGELIGYIIYNPTNKRIQQFAVHPKYRRKGVASALFDKVAKQHGKQVVIINVDTRFKDANAFLSSVGLEIFIKQLEMKLCLTESNPQV